MRKSIKIKLNKSVSTTKVSVSDTEERYQTKLLKINVLMSMSSLREKAEELNLKVNLPQSVKEEKVEPAKAGVVRKTGKKNNLTETKTIKEQSSGTMRSQEKEWEMIKEEWGNFFFSILMILFHVKRYHILYDNREFHFISLISCI